MILFFLACAAQADEPVPVEIPEEVIVDKLATNPGVDEDGLIVLDQFKPKVR